MGIERSLDRYIEKLCLMEIFVKARARARSTAPPIPPGRTRGTAGRRPCTGKRHRRGTSIVGGGHARIRIGVLLVWRY